MSVDPLEKARSEVVECRNARNFAERRLRQAEGVVKPHELAQEYDCTQGHMQDVLAELVDDGVAEKLGWGRYRWAGETGDSESAKSTEEEQLSLDGPTPLLDTDTADESPEDSPVECPYENCDYTGETAHKLQKHANAKPRHDWEAIKEEVGLEDYQEEKEHRHEIELPDEGQEDGTDDDRDGEQGDESEEIVEDVEETTEVGMPSIPIEAVIVVAVAAFAVWWLFFRESSASSGSEQSQEDDEVFGSGLIQ